MLDTIEQFSKPGVRVHILLLPGLVTDALWIKPQNPSSGAASVVPFNTLIEGLKEKTAYSEPDFLEKVQPLARKFVDFRKEPLSIEEQFYQLGIEEKDRLSVIRSAYGKENAP